MDQILAQVEYHLHKIGSANDAEDHQYLDSANQMRSEASTSLYTLMEEHPMLCDILPGLSIELDTGHIYGLGWNALLDQIHTLYSRNKI